VRDRVHHLEFHQLVGKQPQRPPGAAVRRRAARRRDQLGLLLAVELGAVLALRLLLEVITRVGTRLIRKPVIDGNTKIDSTWSRLQGDDKAAPIDWRAQTNTDPAKPPFVILLRSTLGTWQGAKPEAALVCDGRRIDLN